MRKDKKLYKRINDFIEEEFDELSSVGKRIFRKLKRKLTNKKKKRSGPKKRRKIKKTRVKK